MPRSDADSNLLFGINALQHDFITRDALISAMAAWAVAKHRPIGEILVEAGALDPADREALDAITVRRLARHGNDPAASLSAIHSAGGIAEQIRRSIVDPAILQAASHLSTDLGSIDPYATRAGIPAEPFPTSSRFRRGRKHAAGNLGVVYVARDQELNREVALKEIKETHADHLHHQAKFRLEAEITGGLEHPGIVPVYGLGHYDDGRPFYAMRFIRGKSLHSAIREFHDNEALKSDPGQRLLDLQKLLRRFIDVCNAVAYAHSRGVLHRDLKPDNVMVGRYGETLVVDWGLAKALGTLGPEETIEDLDDGLPEGSLQPSTPEHMNETHAGAQVGTPAYMSPEQAAGRLDLLGPASDIYCLGATLYHLIVGRAPITSGTNPEVLARVQAGEITRPRSVAPWLAPALEAICLKAMAIKPSTRYHNARALAGDLERWIAGAPVLAYPEPFIRRARRWAVRHRTGLATAGSALTVAIILVGGITWLEIDRHQKREASGSALLDEASRLADEAHRRGDLALWGKAIDVASRADDLLRAGWQSTTLSLKAKSELETYRSAFDQRDSEIRTIQNLEKARLLGANVKDGHLDGEATLNGFLDVFRNYGINVATLSVEEAARRVRSSRIAEELIATLDEWALHPQVNVSPERLNAIAQAVDTDPVRAAIRKAVTSRDEKALRRFCESKEDRRKLDHRLPSVFYALLQINPVANLPLLDVICREYPANFWLNHSLGHAYRRGGPAQSEDVVRCFSVAVALKSDSPAAHLNLGNALQDGGRYDQAAAEFVEVLRLWPDFAEAHYNLGNVCLKQGKFVDAVASFQAALKIRPVDSESHHNLGVALRELGQVEPALKEFREALRIDPNNGDAHYNLGLQLKKEEPDEAINQFREVLRINRNDADSLWQIGSIQFLSGRFREAVESLERAHKLGIRQHGWNYPTDQWLREARELTGLEGQIPAILKGQAGPASLGQRLALASFFYRTGRHATASRYAEEAFLEKPDLVEDIKQGYRYDAACMASLAGTGLSQDDPALDEASRAKLREKCLGWLQSELATWTKIHDGGNEPARKQAVVKKLDHWKTDPDLAGIRDAVTLEKLPDLERKAFRSFWRDVDALSRKAEGQVVR